MSSLNQNMSAAVMIAALRVPYVLCKAEKKLCNTVDSRYLEFQGTL